MMNKKLNTEELVMVNGGSDGEFEKAVNLIWGAAYRRSGSQSSCGAHKPI